LTILPGKNFLHERKNAMSNNHSHIFDLKITIIVDAGQLELDVRVTVGLGLLA